MAGIEYIEQVFDRASPLAVVEQERHGAQHTPGLQTASHHQLIDQRAQDASEMIAAHKPEQQNETDAEGVIVRAQKDGQHAGRAADGGFQQGVEPFVPGIELLAAVDRGDGEQEGQHDVLMAEFQDAALEAEVKGNLRQEGKNPQAEHVFGQAARVGASLRDTKGEKGEGKAAHDAHPAQLREQYRADMVNGHADDGDELERRAVDHAQLFRNNESGPGLFCHDNISLRISFQRWRSRRPSRRRGRRAAPVRVRPGWCFRRASRRGP